MNTSEATNNQTSASKKKRNKKKNKNKAQTTTNNNDNVTEQTNQSAPSADNNNEVTQAEEKKEPEPPQIPPAPEMNLRSILNVIATQLNEKHGARTSTKWKSAPAAPEDDDEDFDFGESFMDLFSDEAPVQKTEPPPSSKKKKKKKKKNANTTESPPPAPPLPSETKKADKAAEEPKVNTLLPESLATQTLLVQLLQSPQNSSYIRQAAMSLLNMYANDSQVSQEQQKLFETLVNISQFINVNFVHGDHVTSQMASTILKRLSQNSTSVRDAVVKYCVSLLQNTFIVDHMSSSTSVERLADLVTSLSSEDITPILIKHLEKLATRINKVYTPQYKILRSKLGFDGLPFEQQLFEANVNRPVTKPATGSLAAELDSPWATLTALAGDRVEPGKGNGHSKITELDATKDNSADFDAKELFLATSVELNVSFPSVVKYTVIVSGGLNLNNLVPLFEQSEKKEASSFNFFLKQPALCRFIKIAIKLDAENTTAQNCSFECHARGWKIDLEKDIGNSIESIYKRIEKTLPQFGQTLSEKQNTLTTELETFHVTRATKLLSSLHKECLEAQTDYYFARLFVKNFQNLTPTEMLRVGSIEKSEVTEFVAPTNKVVDESDRILCFTRLFLRLLHQPKSETDKTTPAKNAQVDWATAKLLFDSLCVNAPSDIRDAASTWLAHVLDQANDQWVPSLLQQYFSEKNEDHSFNQTQLLDLLVKMIKEEHQYSIAHQVFAMLEHTIKPVTTNKEGFKGINIASISWMLLLLSKVVSFGHKTKSVHQNSMCNNCGMSPISGTRYRCANCVNVDLCERCEQKVADIHDTDHVFLKIRSPLPLPPSAEQQDKESAQLQGPLISNLYKTTEGTEAGTLHKLKKSHSSEKFAATYTHHVECARCGIKNITGIRYKCCNCQDYDLCSDCESKEKHFPLHVFLKIRKPLPPKPAENTNESSLPKPLIPNQALIPLVLHRGLYPTKQPQLKEIANNNNNNVPTSTSSSSTPLTVIFSFLCAAIKESNAKSTPKDTENSTDETLLLAMNILKKVIRQYTFQEVRDTVVTRPEFTTFFNDVLACSSPFVQNTFLELFEAIFDSKTYSETKGSNAENDIVLAKYSLRPSIIAILQQKGQATKKDMAAVEFLLEVVDVLLVKSTTTPKSASTSQATIDSDHSQAEETADLSWRTRSAPLPKQLAQQSKLSEISSEFPVDTQLLNFLLNFVVSLGLSDETVGCWWHIISLFKHSSPQKVSEAKQFAKIIETLLVASEDLQSLLQDVINDILSWLLNSNVSGPNLKTYVLSKVIEVLPSLITCTETKGQPQAMSSNKLLIYSSFVNLLFSKPEVSFNLPITASQLFSIMESMAVAVVNDKQSALNVDVVIPPPTSLATNQLLIKYIASVFTTGLGKPKEPNPAISKLANELLQMLLAQIGSKTGSHVLKTLIEWLGKQTTLHVLKKAADTTSTTTPKSFLDPFRKSFKSNILKIVFVLCENQEVSKQVLAICCEMLSTDNFSMSLVQLCKKLTTNDVLTKYLLLEKGGFSQLTQFLLKHNSNKTVAHSDLSTAILSQLYASTSVTTTDDDNIPTTSSYKLTKPGQLEEFGPVSDVLVADGNLANTLKESASSNSYVWTKKPTVPGGDTSFSIKFPFSVVLSEIVLTVYKNWYVDNDPSEFPTRVAFFVGNSPQKQKKPLGRFQFSESYATGTGNSQLQTYKFPIAASLKTVSKYITLKFTFDGNKPIAITRVQLRGVSVGNYNYSSQTGVTVSSSLMSGVGDLLSHCVQFAEVQKQLSQQFLNDASMLKSTLELLNNVTSDTQSAIEDTLFFLAKGNDKLLPTLFDFLLNDKMSSFQAQLVARLLCGAPVSPDKLLEVKSYVFSALQSSQTIPVVMLPLMSALSFSVSKLRTSPDRSRLQQDLSSLTEQQLLVLYNHCVNNLEGTQSFEQSLRLLSAYVQTNASYYQTIVTNFQKSQASVLEDAKSKTLLDSKSLKIVSNLVSASLPCGEIVLKTDLITSFAKKLTGLMKEALSNYKDFQQDEPYIQQLFTFFGDASYNAVVREWQSQTLVPDLLNVLHTLLQDPDKSEKKSLINAITKQLTQSARLNIRSQQQLGEFVVTIIQESLKTKKDKKDASLESELKVVESILSMENTIGVCASNLHAKADYGGSNNVKMALEFDTTNLSSAVVDGSVAKITQNNYIYVTLRATVGWSTGYHYFEFEINGSTNNIFVGVVEATHAVNTYTGQWHASNFSVGLMGSSSPWLYISNNSNGGKQWGTQFGKGDFIGVAVDFTEYTIEYFKNGESLGVAYNSDSNPSFEGKTLYPAVTLYAPGDEVTLIGHGKSPLAFGSDHAPAKAAVKGGEMLDAVGAECPLRYHRSHPVYTLNVETPLSTLNESLQVGLTKGQDNKVQFFAGPQQINESTTPLQLLQNSVNAGHNNTLLPAIVDAEYTFGKEAANVPALPKPENAVYAVNRVIELVVEKNALGFLLESLTSSIGEIVTTEVQKQNNKSAVDSAANPTLECLLVWSRWFDWLQVLSQLDGFSRAFLNSKRCKHFLFTALRGDFLPKPKKDGTPTKELSDERAAEMFEPMMECVLQLMKATSPQEKQAIALRQQITKINLMERCLLYISDCSGIESRNQRTEITYGESINSIKKSYEMHKAKVKEHEDEKKKNSKTFWAKGTGYGTSHDATTDWDHVSYTKTVIAKAKQIAMFVDIVNEFLSVSTEVMNDPVKFKMFFPEDLLTVLEGSCLVPTLISYFRNDSILELMRQKELYETLFKLTRTLSSNPTLLTLFDSLPNESTSIKSLLRKLNGMAELLITTSKKAAKINKTTDSEPALQVAASTSSPAEPTAEGEVVLESEKPAFSQTEELAFAKTIIDLHKFVADSLAQQEKRKTQSNDPESDVKSDKPKLSDYDQLFSQYRELLEPLQFGERTMADEEGNYTHHYGSRIASEAIGASSTKLKRLVQELSSLATGLPMSLESSVFLRVDEERPDVMQALITGPAATPYSNGCFQFDIYCPNDYPKVPPQVNLETTGNGTVRFNPNLYNCGKVCLSLLGTWSGAQNEQWNEKTSTILQVLVSVQSLIFVEKPYFNEPGYENSMNTPQGDKSNKEYNQNIRMQTARWAMVDQLRKPSLGFEDVIRNHFKLKKDIVIKELEQWVKESPTGQGQAMQEQLDAFKKEVEKLSNTNRND